MKGKWYFGNPELIDSNHRIAVGSQDNDIVQIQNFSFIRPKDWLPGYLAVLKANIGELGKAIIIEEERSTSSSEGIL